MERKRAHHFKKKEKCGEIQDKRHREKNLDSSRVAAWRHFFERRDFLGALGATYHWCCSFDFFVEQERSL